MAATAVTLNDLEGHSPVAGLFKCNPSIICTTFTRFQLTVLAWFLCISRASCLLRDRIAYRAHHCRFVLIYSPYFKFCFIKLSECQTVVFLNFLTREGWSQCQG